MDQATRNKLRGVVTQCRRLLEDAVSQELQGKFGIYAAKKDEVQVDDEARMSHLTGEERAARKDILDHFAHIKARGFKPKEALDQLVREIAYTHLNRLCAYKMMEARQVYVGDQKFREAVSRGVNSNGVKFYLADHTDDERLYTTGNQELAYRHFLDWLGGLLSEEIGVLFSPNDPANRLYPPQRVLDEVLALINDEALAGIWEQDETIGWIYQYFTPKELRDQARKESQAPRNSYELAFRNQFFTPRYVVEFLSDNTLGRIWYEMRKGDTKVKDQCRFMVRRPSEVFLAEKQQSPNGAAEVKNDLPQEELLKLPFRAKKDPRELKILDPACGSGHFLLYCFDLLLTIYEEAYADAELGPAFQRDYPTLDALRRDVPRLILAHNLHGIDIDLRATQIAALALWLRCQRAYQEIGLKKDRPKITRSNFVCAEPMPGEQAMLKEFVGQLEPKLLGQLVEVVFDKMKLAGEAGSLLKIEEEIRDTVAAAKRQWLSGPVSIQRTLFDDDKPVVRQQRFDFSGITDAQFFEQAEAKVVDALRNYAEKAQNGQRLQRRLFTEDAVRGFAFVDLCHRRFDVVLMNPPFGVCSVGIEKYMRTKWRSLANDIYVLFLVLHSDRLAVKGLLGAITSRGFMIGRDQRDFRPLLLGEGSTCLDLLLDLGLDVLDTAAVETCAYVLRQASALPPNHSVRFIDCRAVDRSSLEQLLALLPHQPAYSHASSRFRGHPDCTLIYAASDEEIKSFSSTELLDPAFGKVTKGLNSSCDERFIRLMWEVDARCIRDRWQFCAKGADYQWFITNITAVVDWADNGRLIREHTASVSTNVAQAYRSSKYYYRPALTYTYRCSDFSLRALPEGCLFTNAAPVIICKDTEAAERGYIGLLSAFLSDRYERLLAHISKKGKYETGLIGKLPVPALGKKERLQSAWSAVTKLLLTFEASLETTPYFTAYPFAEPFFVDSNDLEARIREFADCSGMTPSEAFIDRATRGFVDRYVKANSWPHAVISYLLGLAVGRWDIRYALSSECPVANSSPFAALPRVPPGTLEVGRATSTTPLPIGYPVSPSMDGYLVDDPDHPDDMVGKMRACMDVLWKNRAGETEKRICAALGIDSVRDYLRKPGGFWSEHIKRYTSCLRKAPIYWLLQSSKKNYALWLYYHRLDKDLLFKALVNYVEPKIRLEDSRLEALRTQKAAAGGSGREAKRLGKEVERQEEFLSELRDFEDKLRRAANMHLEPDLNDGVILNIAPLRELVPWKEAKNYWEELLDGKYEWSSIGKQLRQKELVK
jgi:hypothetical protein